MSHSAASGIFSYNLMMLGTLLQYSVIGIAVILVLYGLFIGILILLGRKQDARAWAGLIPNCIVLFKRLMSDPKVPASRKWILVLLIGYLALPIDLIPDFIPVAGQLDDVIIVALVLSWLIRSIGEDKIRSNWPGPENSINKILKLVNRKN